MEAVKPDPIQYQNFLNQQSVANPQGLVILGNSRYNLLGNAGLKVQYPSMQNFAISGTTVENYLWELQNDTHSYAGVHAAIIGDAVNSIRYTSDTWAQIKNGMMQIVDLLITKLAPGAHIYVMGTFDCLPGTANYDETLAHTLNDSLAWNSKHGDYAGKFVFVPVELPSADYFRAGDTIHESSTLGVDYIDSIIHDALAAHGDFVI